MASGLGRRVQFISCFAQGHYIWIWPVSTLDVDSSLVCMIPIFLAFVSPGVNVGLTTSIHVNTVLLLNRLIWHFDLKKFRPNEVNRVKISLACVFAFMFIGWPLIIYKTGIVGWIKFWLMPWLGYHFWVTLLPVVFYLFFPCSLKHFILEETVKFFFIKIIMKYKEHQQGWVVLQLKY